MAYEWVDDPSVTSYANAGCLTVVVGSTRDEVLRLVGADDSRPVAPDSVSGSEGLSWVSVAEVAPASSPVAVVLIEDAGWEGSRPEVLARLSKEGAAASVYWDVNGMVMFGCARGGKVKASLELQDADDLADELPAALRRVWERNRASDGPVAVAMAMIEKFTRVVIQPGPDLAQPGTAFPVVEPLLALRATPDELRAGRSPSEAVFAAAQAAPKARCREVAEWAVTEALSRAAVRDLPALAPTVAQFGTGRQVSIAPATSGFRREADRGCSAADWALSVESDHARWESLRHWCPKYWAMEALAYLAVADDVVAVLGATYCAGIPLRLGSEEHHRFLNEAERRLLE